MLQTIKLKPSHWPSNFWSSLLPWKKKSF